MTTKGTGEATPLNKEAKILREAGGISPMVKMLALNKQIEEMVSLLYPLPIEAKEDEFVSRRHILSALKTKVEEIEKLKKENKYIPDYQWAIKDVLKILWKDECPKGKTEYDKDCYDCERWKEEK